MGSVREGYIQVIDEEHTVEGRDEEDDLDQTVSAT